MGRKRKRLERGEGWDAAKWLYRYFEAMGHHRQMLRDLHEVLRDLQVNREVVWHPALSELQALVDELPAPVWTKCSSYLRMNAGRRRKESVSIEVPREVKARLQDYQTREGLPSIVAALDQLLAAQN